MIAVIKKHFLIFFFLVLISLYFINFLIKGLFPIPADTIVGMYHPFRDYFVQDYARGYPFKNFLITDPIRQQYPWKKLVIEFLKKKELPVWNNYSFSGTPLLANFQSGTFYPFNFLFFLFDFNLAWSFYILIQPFLAIIFMYLFLGNKKLSNFASLLGGLAFGFSGFIVSWFEWGNIGHTVLWLPLILYSIDKFFVEKKKYKFLLLFLFVSCFSFFAGHLQIAFYIQIFTVCYLVYVMFSNKKIIQSKTIKLVLLIYFLLLLITSIQWIPSFKFIMRSMREIDIPQILFIPWENLIQFIFPDFFGNPATLNYWGKWNYGEYVSYIGIIPFFFAFLFFFTTKFRKKIFFKLSFILSILLATNNFISQIPFKLQIPFISTSSPARLLIISCFSLSVLAAYGAEGFLKKNSIKQFFIFSSIIFGTWIFTLLMPKIIHNSLATNLLITKRNLIFPSAIFLGFCGVYFLHLIGKKKFKSVLMMAILFLLLFDLLRFFNKYNPFVKKDFIFPDTKILTFLQNQEKPFRIMSLDDRILPANFSSIYHLETIQGYDPLFLRDYGEFIAELENNYSFNRQINPKNINSDLVNLLNVKYILSFEELPPGRFVKIIEEGQTKLFENKNVLPRFYFSKEGQCEGKIEILRYSSNETILEIESKKNCFVIVSDAYYPNLVLRINHKIEKAERVNQYQYGFWVVEGKSSVKIKRVFNFY